MKEKEVYGGDRKKRGFSGKKGAFTLEGQFRKGGKERGIREITPGRVMKRKGFQAGHRGEKLME